MTNVSRTAANSLIFLFDGDLEDVLCMLFDTGRDAFANSTKTLHLFLVNNLGLLRLRIFPDLSTNCFPDKLCLSVILNPCF